MSFAVALIVERPVIAMEKMLFRKQERPCELTLGLPKEMSSNITKVNALTENGKITSM